MPRIAPASLAALLIVILMMPVSAMRGADGKLDVVERFARGKAELALAHYTDPAADKPNGKVGLIGIASPDRNSFAFNQAEWAQLIALCDKAIGTRSHGWTQVGTMTETETQDVSQLTVSAGPGVGFVITSPDGGTVSYAIPRSELPRLQKGLRAVADYLGK